MQKVRVIEQIWLSRIVGTDYKNMLSGESGCGHACLFLGDALLCPNFGCFLQGRRGLLDESRYIAV